MYTTAFGILTLTSTLSITLTSATTWTYEGTTVTLALVNYTYRDPRRDGVLVEVGQFGKYAPGQVFGASGRVVVGPESQEVTHNENSCVFPWSPPFPAPVGPWVALMGMSSCPDVKKVGIAARNNATAVILYTADQHAHLRKISMDYPELAVVWLGMEEGRSLARVVEGGADVEITLAPGHHLRYHSPSVSRTSVLFVSVSFIILMAISLAWLVFYYVQRFRYIHAKDRLARHLCNAAKKALAKIPVKNLKATDREVSLDGECCAVCIELYQVGEAVRTLPCKHQFHRCCVDPWLLEHRTCPMCKMDILKHYGYVWSESEESVLQLDMGDGGEGGHSGPDATPTRSLGPHTSRAAPHLTPVVMVSRSDGGSEGGGMGSSVGGMAGVESPLPDTPISPTHTHISQTPPSSLLSLLSPASKSSSPSLSSSVTLEKCSPSSSHQDGATPAEVFHPHHAASSATTGGGEMDVEVSSVCSGEKSSTSSRASTPDAAPAQEETPPISTTPSPPRRSKRRSLAEEVTTTAPTRTSPAALQPTSHIVSVSHF